MEFGALCLIPPIVVILLAMLSRRAFEPLLVGCLVGFLIINYREFPGNFITALTDTLRHQDMVWIILVCGLYGSLIHLMIQSGGVFAFGNRVLEHVKTRKSALLTTWAMGLLIFIDDYMSALATGVTMRKITDQFHISRPLLAYLVNATAAPVCVLIPMSTWSIYVGKLLEEHKVVPEHGGFDGFLALIPYMFYPWLVVILALLIALDKIPLFSKMKLAEAAAIQPAQNISEEQDTTAGKSAYFFIPLIILIVATLFFDKDALKGVMVALVCTFLYYGIVGVMRFTEVTDGIFEGFKSMVFALAILTMSYVLKTTGDKLGLTPYVIHAVQPVLSKEFLAAAIFVCLSFISYTTASSWGMYAVAIPIVVPLAYSMGANTGLALAAVISAGAFGSQASFFSDVTILTATSTECNNMELSHAQLPYNLIAWALSTLAFLAFGFF